MSSRRRLVALSFALLLVLGSTGCETTGSGYYYDTYPNTVQTGDDIVPAPGYVWVYPNDPDDYSVRWSPGLAHTDHPNVIADQQVNNWVPAPGYVWIDPGNNDDLRVIRE